MNRNATTSARGGITPLLKLNSHFARIDKKEGQQHTPRLEISHGRAGIERADCINQFPSSRASGKHMLTLSSSQFDPKLSSEPTAAHCFALLQSATFIHAKTLHTIAVGLKQEGANRETKDSDRCPAPYPILRWASMNLYGSLGANDPCCGIL